MAMFKVEWHGCDEEYQPVVREHGTFDTLEAAQNSVREWWKKNDFEPPYIRQWKHDNTVVWDYGSHTCFYHFVEEEQHG